MSFLRVGFYIDSDLLYYWMVTQFKIYNYNKIFKLKKNYWHKITLEFLKYDVFFSNKIKLYKQIEYIVRHNGIFIYLKPKYCRYRFKKNNVVWSGSDYNFLISRIYLNYMSQYKSNKYNYIVTKNEWIINYSTFEKMIRLNLSSLFFMNKCKIKNVFSVLIFDNFYNNYNKIIEKTKFYSTGHNYFFVAAFWLFQRYELLCYMLKFCCRSSRKKQYRRYYNLRRLYFYYFMLWKIYNNIVNIIINLWNLKNSVIRSKKFTNSFFNKGIFNNKLLNIPLFGNDLFNNNILKLYLNKQILPIIVYSDKEFNVVKNYKLNNSINYQNIYFDNLYYFGNSVGNSRFLNYGALLLVIFHNSNFFKYYNLKSKYIYNLLKLKIKLTNYIYFILNFNKINQYINKDLFYFYIDLKNKTNLFKFWQWYTFFSGCDFHVNWGWYGTKKKKKLKKRHLINKLFLTPSVWMLKYVNELF